MSSYSGEDLRFDQGPDRPTRGDPAAGRHPARPGVRDRAARSRRVSARPHRTTEQGSRTLAAVVPGEGVLRADRVRVYRHAVKFLVDANVLSEATKPTPD